MISPQNTDISKFTKQSDNTQMLFFSFHSHAQEDAYLTQESTLTIPSAPNEFRDIGSSSANFGKILNAFTTISAMFSPFSNGPDIALIGVIPKSRNASKV